MAGFGVRPSQRQGTPTTSGSTGVGVISQVGVGGGQGPSAPPISSIAQLLSSGMPQASQAAPVGAPVPTPVAMPAAAPVVNTAQANPTATGVANRLANATPDSRASGIVDTLAARAKGDMGLGREIDRGAQDIRSRALAGIAGDRLSRVARGVNGTGIDTFDANRQSDQQRGDIDVNRMVNDRTIAAEAMRNDLLGSTANLSMGVAGQASANQIAGGNMALNTSGQQLQAQGQNTAAALGQSDLALRRQAQQNDQQNTAWNMAESAGARARDEQLRNFQTILNFLT
jgi:hypothetical protein